MNNYQRVKIQELAHSVTSGGTPSRSNKKFFDGEIPWVKSGELNNWYVFDTDEHINIDAINNSSAKLFKKDSVMVAMYGQGETIGKVGLLGQEASTNQAICVIEVDQKIADPHFLMYLLQYKRLSLVALSQGAARRNLNVGKIANFEINVPELSLQKKISRTLSNYDYLIENNSKRIKILEEMAQRLYEEWFVNFKFPGYDKAEMVDSELGKIPEGWTIKQFGQFVKIRGKKVKADNIRDQRYYFPIDCIERKQILVKTVKPISEAKSSLQQFYKNDILLGAMRPYFHKVTIAPFDGITRNTCFVFKPIEDLSREFILFTLFRDQAISYISQNVRGSTIPYAVWKGGLDKYQVITPTKELLKKFSDIVRPITEEIKLTFYKNRNLKLTRDLLLPRLISGEIEV